MSPLSTRYAAKKLGIDPGTLSRYITAGKIPAPKTVEIGGLRVHSWTEEDIETVRALLPKIANGRKTRYQKQRKKGTTRKPKR
ncbi:MAG TPA: helix-turn-helix domain-containing protein [Candidatus Angelobacter sp.]